MKKVTLDDILKAINVFQASLNNLSLAVENIDNDLFDLRVYTESGFETMNNRFDDLEARVDAHDSRFDALETRFDDFERRVDKRFEDFECRVDDRFDTLECRLDGLSGSAYQH